MSRLEVRVPDIGAFDEVDVVEVLVSTGDRVEEEDSLITLESDKASMEVPSPAAGTVAEIAVGVGDKVGEGDLIAVLEEAQETIRAGGEEQAEVAAEPREAVDRPPSAEGPDPRPAPPPPGGADAQLLVLGSGPGGYTAAFRAADLGLDVTLVERYPTLGGVCLNVGCIPSKALLHAAEVIEEAGHFAELGLGYEPPKLDLERLRGWKRTVVDRLTGGLRGLAKRRRVTVIEGDATLVSPQAVEIATAEGTRRLTFEQAILAAGSRPLELPGLPAGDARLLDSTSALELVDVPARLLVIGGGIIGLEMAGVYAALGARITVIELTDRLIPEADRDLVRVLQKRIEARYEAVRLATEVVRLEPEPAGLRAHFAGDDGGSELFDRVLVAVGRRPNSDRIGADAAGLGLDERGYVLVDHQLRTDVPRIFAIGDLTGPPLLAHKASHQGKVAAEVAAGHKAAFDARAIPSVAYTDPEIAWVGLTEREAEAGQVPYEKGTFPWSASGRALSLGRDDGLTQLLFDPDSRRLLGAGVVGPRAGDLIAELALALEMGCEAADLALTIHPHPTLSETVMFAAEAFEGTLTDLYLPKKRRR